MVTKYTTGDRVLIPGVVTSMREQDGVIYYNVDTYSWDGFPEEDITPRETMSTRETMEFMQRINEKAGW